MIFASAIFCSIADMLWGGQFQKWLGGHDRLPAIALIFAALFITLGNPILALVGMTGYIAVRISGWRFFYNRELFLTMERPMHIAYAFIHGLLFLTIPVITWLAYESPLKEGLIYWLFVSGFLAFISFIVVNAVRKIDPSRDFIPIKEAIWGFIFGAVSYAYFAPLA